MAESLALPLVTMSAGAALLVVGGTQLAAVVVAKPGQFAPGEQLRLGAVAAALLALGTAAEVFGSIELEERRQG